MKALAVLTLALAVFVTACGTGKTTDTDSTAFPTLEARQEFLERYVQFRRNYDDLEFRMSFIDGSSGMAPGPTEWDIRLLATVPTEEIDQWIDGLRATTKPDLNWVNDIPSAPSALSDFDWHEDEHRLVGIDRAKRMVLYRNRAS